MIVHVTATHQMTVEFKLLQVPDFLLNYMHEGERWSSAKVNCICDKGQAKYKGVTRYKNKVFLAGHVIWVTRKKL